MKKATTRLALAAACMVAGLGALPVQAKVVTGDIGKLEVAQVAQCKSANLTLSIQPSGEEGIAGTEFSLAKLADIDLSTQVGWDAVGELDAAKAAQARTEGTWRATTDAAGDARFHDLPVGAYLVSATVPAHGRNATPQDFVLTLPVGSESGWDCSPKVFAKMDTPPESTPAQPPAESTPPRPPYPPFNPPTLRPEPTPTPTPTPTQTPTRPSEPTAPATTPPQSGTSQRPGLASTGASVLGIVGMAAVLILAGALLARRKRDADQPGQEGR
ncbi:SpaA isopeptide-forming pilin-related protein [Corynebacterium lizhenjunii]|uniref:SpaA isopeptide-forming pilin-related protein n=1 Tax=Corynebacterium lizhenjunii TaxID=2709394 RepID=UPI0013EA08F2|nr:SpaA isopeptide-forming pilin-related protein [Corynebacterium lizhenjunii]